MESQFKTIKGWRTLKHEGGYINECTGQTLVIAKKQFSSNYHVLIFVAQRTEEKDGRIISPEFSTETKAEAYAVKLMAKQPNGIA
ncbi:MAG: hypothetical protein ACQCN6_13615 [Candidatus Bathyarchaeia archaeon]